MTVTNLQKGDCQHCRKEYCYQLWHSGFSDMSYAYCDTCGMVATLDYWNKNLSRLPPMPSHYLEIDAALEPFLRQCSCGGHFRKGASPRCPHCNATLSADHAAGHIERNSPGSAKGWHWQRSWNGLYCIAIEDPANPGNLRWIKDPLLWVYDPAVG
jgi:hypothetical protein